MEIDLEKKKTAKYYERSRWQYCFLDVQLVRYAWTKLRMTRKASGRKIDGSRYNTERKKHKRNHSEAILKDSNGEERNGIRQTAIYINASESCRRDCCKTTVLRCAAVSRCCSYKVQVPRTFISVYDWLYYRCAPRWRERKFGFVDMIIYKWII